MRHPSNLSPDPLNPRKLRESHTTGGSPYCFPAEVIRHAVWLYVRFTLSCRDVEEFLAEWGIVVTRA
jgi:transposase-like protein